MASHRGRKAEPENLLGSVHRMGVGPKGSQLRCGIFQTPEGFSEREFITPQYAIVYLAEGSGWYVDNDGHSHRLESGCIFQRFPSRTHQIRIETPSLRCFIGVPCQVFELFALTGLSNPQKPVLSFGAGPELVQEFVKIREALRGQPDHDLTPVLLRMQEFIAGLLRKGRERAADAGTSEPIATAMQFLNENLAERLHLPDVARRVHMSYSLFRKRFLARVGTSPGDYRIRRRIERAMALLTRGKLLVKEIAAQLGYPDEYAFSAQFKKVAGVSPTEFRERHG